MSTQTTKTVQVDDSGALVAPAASTFKTANDLLGSGDTAADVDPAGTAIAAALLAKADLTGGNTFDASAQVLEIIKALGVNGVSIQDDAGTAILEIGKDANTYAVKLIGVLETSGGSLIGMNVTSAGSINANNIGQLRPVSGTGIIVESLIGGEDLYLRGRTAANPTGNLIIGDLGELIKIDRLDARTVAGLIAYNSVGTEKLKVGASTGADVQVTGTLSTTDTLTAETAIGKAVSVNAQTGLTYTLVLGDAGLIVTMTNASANTLTIPTNASVAYATGTVINVIMGGAGTTSITGDTGVTVNGISAGSGDISAQYQGVALIKTGTDTWIASGAIGTVA